MRVRAFAVLVFIGSLSAVIAACGSKSPTEPTPSCTATLSPLNQTFDANGGTGSVTVSVSAGCNWTATSSGAWIAVTAGGTGNGAGTVAVLGDSEFQHAGEKRNAHDRGPGPLGDATGACPDGVQLRALANHCHLQQGRRGRNVRGDSAHGLLMDGHQQRVLGDVHGRGSWRGEWQRVLPSRT